MLQQSVLGTMAPGVPGDKATLNPTAYTVHNPVAEGEGVTAGQFVWRGTDAERQAKVGGTGQPLGLVERLLVYPGQCGGDSATLVIPEGQPLTVMKKGDMYVATTTAATVGQKVFAVLATGAIATGTAGGTVSGAVETSWKVESAGQAGDIIAISNYD